MKQNPMIAKLRDDPEAMAAAIADFVGLEVDDPEVAKQIAATVVNDLTSEFGTKKNLLAQAAKQLVVELGERKFRLLLAACCRHALSEKFRKWRWDEEKYALDVLEEFADTGKGNVALRKCWSISAVRWTSSSYSQLNALHLALSPTDPDEALLPCVEAIRDTYQLSEQEAWNELNRFHRDLESPLPNANELASAWRTPSVFELAKSMYESRDFGAMPQLAMALEQAGCDQHVVLDHCREADLTHIRGCWVLDAILGGWIAKRPAMPKKTEKVKSTLRGLTEGDLEIIDAFMKREHNGGQLTVDELCERKFRRDLTETIEVFRRLRPSYSEEQIREISLWGEMSGDGLFPPDTVERGIARRVTFDSPLELAKFLAIGARYDWINRGDGSRDPERLYIPMLHAIAAHDFVAASRFAESGPRTFNKSDARKYGLIYFAVVALLTDDKALLGQVGDEMRRRKPSGYDAGLFESLIGAAEGSSAKVASGLERMLRGYTRGLMHNDILRFVDPQAHGIYELCFRIDPALVSAVDVARKTPWDAEYHAWLRTGKDPLEGFDLKHVSPKLHQTIMQLPRPIWWDAPC